MYLESLSDSFFHLGIHKTNQLCNDSFCKKYHIKGYYLMIFSRKPFRIFPFLFFLLCLLLSAYFALASVQGDFGIVKRLQVQKEAELLKIEYQQLSYEIKKLENRTRRLSDDFLDFDLLDTQAREILGVLRPQEIIIN